MNIRAALGWGALAAIATPRGVPSRTPVLAQSSGACGWVMMYLGMEIAMSFSPLSTGSGVGLKELTNIGLLAASPLRKSLHSLSFAKIPASFRPTSQEMVVACEEGSGMTILSRHFGLARSLYSFGTSPGLTRFLL